MMATEFHGLELACSSSSIIPQGTNYSDVAHQSCAIFGSIPGSLTVSGDSYVVEGFGYLYSNVWRNTGIVILFTVAFIALGALFSELIEWTEGGSGALEFKGKPNNKIHHSAHARDEEEKAVEFHSSSLQTTNHNTPANTSEESLVLAASKTTFTWKNLNYTVPYDGKTKKLLDNVSGYCAPGQMTALVGSSGAGKTTCKCSTSI